MLNFVHLSLYLGLLYSFINIPSSFAPPPEDYNFYDTESLRELKEKIESSVPPLWATSEEIKAWESLLSPILDGLRESYFFDAETGGSLAYPAELESIYRLLEANPRSPTLLIQKLPSERLGPFLDALDERIIEESQLATIKEAFISRLKLERDFAFYEFKDSLIKLFGKEVLLKVEEAFLNSPFWDENVGMRSVELSEIESELEEKTYESTIIMKSENGEHKIRFPLDLFFDSYESSKKEAKKILGLLSEILATFFPEKTKAFLESFSSRDAIEKLVLERAKKQLGQFPQERRTLTPMEERDLATFVHENVSVEKLKQWFRPHEGEDVFPRCGHCSSPITFEQENFSYKWDLIRELPLHFDCPSSGSCAPLPLIPTRYTTGRGLVELLLTMLKESEVHIELDKLNGLLVDLGIFDRNTEIKKVKMLNTTSFKEDFEMALEESRELYGPNNPLAKMIDEIKQVIQTGVDNYEKLNIDQKVMLLGHYVWLPLDQLRSLYQKALQDNIPSVVYIGLSSLYHFLAPASDEEKRSMEFLLDLVAELTQDQSPKIRKEALKILGLMNLPKRSFSLKLNWRGIVPWRQIFQLDLGINSEEILVRALQDPESSVRNAATVALLRLISTPPNKKTLIALIKALPTLDEILIFTLFQSFEQYFPEHQRIVEDSMNSLILNCGSAFVERVAKYFSEHPPKTKKTIDNLLTIMSYPNSNIRLNVTKALIGANTNTFTFHKKLIENYLVSIDQREKSIIDEYLKRTLPTSSDFLFTLLSSIHTPYNGENISYMLDLLYLIGDKLHSSPYTRSSKKFLNNPSFKNFQDTLLAVFRETAKNSPIKGRLIKLLDGFKVHNKEAQMAVVSLLLNSNNYNSGTNNVTPYEVELQAIEYLLKLKNPDQEVKDLVNSAISRFTGIPLAKLVQFLSQQDPLPHTYEIYLHTLFKERDPQVKKEAFKLATNPPFIASERIQKALIYYPLADLKDLQAFERYFTALKQISPDVEKALVNVLTPFNGEVIAVILKKFAPLKSPQTVLNLIRQIQAFPNLKTDKIIELLEKLRLDRLDVQETFVQEWEKRDPKNIDPLLEVLQISLPLSLSEQTLISLANLLKRPTLSAISRGRIQFILVHNRIWGKSIEGHLEHLNKQEKIPEAQHILTDRLNLAKCFISPWSKIRSIKKAK